MWHRHLSVYYLKLLWQSFLMLSDEWIRGCRWWSLSSRFRRRRRRRWISPGHHCWSSFPEYGSWDSIPPAVNSIDSIPSSGFLMFGHLPEKLATGSNWVWISWWTSIDLVSRPKCQCLRASLVRNQRWHPTIWRETRSRERHRLLESVISLCHQSCLVWTSWTVLMRYRAQMWCILGLTGWTQSLFRKWSRSPWALFHIPNAVVVMNSDRD